MTTTLHINPTPWPLAADKIEGHWTQGTMHDGDRMCLVGGLESCGLAPGEWLIARAVARHRDHDADVAAPVRTAEGTLPAPDDHARPTQPRCCP